MINSLKRIMFLGGMVLCGSAGAIPESYVNVAEVKDKNILELFWYGASKGFLLIAAMVMLYCLVQVGFAIISKLSEARKNNEWSEFFLFTGLSALSVTLVFVLMYGVTHLVNTGSGI